MVSSDDINAFRFAHWPGRPVEPKHVPPVWTRKYFVSGDWPDRLVEVEHARDVRARKYVVHGALIEGEPDSGAEVHPPKELFLGGLLKLDVENPDAVAAFMSENGHLDRWDWEETGVALGVFDTRAGANGWGAFCERLKLLLGPGQARRGAFRVVEAMEQLRLARDATRYYLAAMGKVDVEDALAASESAILRPPDSREDVSSWAHGRVDLMEFEDLPERRRIWMARALEDIVNLGLREFPMTIQVAGVDADRFAHIWREGPTLFGLLCLQIADHIASGATLRQCKNESCGQWFSRQSGRAEYGQHRMTGVLYCSASCARTQGSREWRRRKRAEKEGSK